MKFGDQVLFTESGKEFTATVLSERILDHHMGSNDEPLLSLGFFVEVPGVLGTARQNELVQFRADVAHESHEFGEAAKVAKFSGIYPGGRWEELAGGVPIPPVATAQGVIEVLNPDGSPADVKVEQSEDGHSATIIPNKELGEGNKAEPESDESKTDEPKPTLQ